MSPDDGPRRWRRPERAGTVSDAIELLRRTIRAIRTAPGDAEARRQLRAIAGEHGLWDELGLLLADEVRACADRPEIAAVLYEELAGVHDMLDQPLETIAALEALIAIAPAVAHYERLALLYRQAGAWHKAADAFEQVALRAADRQADAALAAAARINREYGRLDRAEAMAQLEQVNAHFRNTVESGPGGRQVLLDDPDGNPIELHEAPRT